MSPAVALCMVAVRMGDGDSSRVLDQSLGLSQHRSREGQPVLLAELPLVQLTISGLRCGSQPCDGAGRGNSIWGTVL